MFIDSNSEFMSARKRVVSSAIKLIFNSVSFIFIPFMFESFLIFIASTSAISKKSRADIGHPCRIDLVNLKMSGKKLCIN